MMLSMLSGDGDAGDAGNASTVVVLRGWRSRLGAALRWRMLYMLMLYVLTHGTVDMRV